MSSSYQVNFWVLPLKRSTSSDLSRELNLSISVRRGVDEQINDMLQQGVIQPSKSPWNSPLFLVPKKNGQFRPVIDFRKVNEVTEDDRFPLPVLSYLLMSLGHGNKILSSLDLLNPNLPSVTYMSCYLYTTLMHATSHDKTSLNKTVSCVARTCENVHAWVM